MKLYFCENFKNRQDSTDLLKKALDDYVHKKIKWNILKSKSGKPYVNYPNLYFNISHSGNYWICGIADKPVGVDIEMITKREHSKLVAVYFSHEEKMYVSKKKNEGFFEIWTLKEAYSKLLGESIFKNLKFNAVFLDELKSREETENIYFKQCKEFKNAKCTLAKAEKDIFLEIIEIN